MGLGGGAAVAGIGVAVGSGSAVEEVGDASPPQAAKMTMAASEMATRGGHAIFFIALWGRKRVICNPYYRSPSKGRDQGPGANRGSLREEATQVVNESRCHLVTIYKSSIKQAPALGPEVAARAEVGEQV